MWRVVWVVGPCSRLLVPHSRRILKLRLAHTSGDNLTMTAETSSRHLARDSDFLLSTTTGPFQRIFPNRKYGREKSLECGLRWRGELVSDEERPPGLLSGPPCRVPAQGAASGPWQNTRKASHRGNWGWLGRLAVCRSPHRWRRQSDNPGGSGQNWRPFKSQSKDIRIGGLLTPDRR